MKEKKSKIWNTFPVDQVIFQNSNFETIEIHKKIIRFIIKFKNPL